MYSFATRSPTTTHVAASLCGGAVRPQRGHDANTGEFVRSGGNSRPFVGEAAKSSQNLPPVALSFREI